MRAQVMAELPARNVKKHLQFLFWAVWPDMMLWETRKYKHYAIMILLAHWGLWARITIVHA